MTLRKLVIPPPPNPLVVATESLRVNVEDVPVRVTYPRASSIVSACLRLHVLAMKFPLYRKRKFNALPARIAFSIGNAYHYWLQNSPDIYGDTRRGWWRCRGCRKVNYWGAPPTEKCKHCGAFPEALEYMEHPMEIKGTPWYMSGHPDLYLTSGTKKAGCLVTNELKSIKNGNADKWDWDNIVEPLADHKAQVMAYLMGAEHDAIFKKHQIKIDPTVGRISYIAKGNFGNLLPIKTFEMIRKNNKDLEEHIIERLHIFSEGFNNFPNKLPPCEAKCHGTNFSHYSAKDCPGVTQCQEFFKKGNK